MKILRAAALAAVLGGSSAAQAMGSGGVVNGPDTNPSGSGATTPSGVGGTPSDTANTPSSGTGTTSSPPGQNPGSPNTQDTTKNCANGLGQGTQAADVNCNPTRMQQDITSQPGQNTSQGTNTNPGSP